MLNKKVSMYTVATRYIHHGARHVSMDLLAPQSDGNLLLRDIPPVFAYPLGLRHPAGGRYHLLESLFYFIAFGRDGEACETFA